MLHDRHYDIPNQFEASGLPVLEPMQHISKLWMEALKSKQSLAECAHIAVQHKFQHSKIAYIWVLDRNYDLIKCKDRMISTDQIKALNQRILKFPAGHDHIVLSPHKLSPQAKKEVLNTISLFIFDELMICLSKHELVVPHIPVTVEKAKQFLGQALDPLDLPKLLRSDAVCRWYNFEVGQIVYIKNPIMPSWRIVHNG